MPASDQPRFVSRGGDKLAAALDAFAIRVTGRCAADLGSNVGGFVDCLLQRGAARVHAVERGYGVLAYRLRRDPRVVVHERTSVLSLSLPELVELVTIDVGWTRQRHVLPVARRLLAPRGQIVSLVKPHYEAGPARLKRGVLPIERLDEVLAEVRAALPAAGLALCGEARSALVGRGGNVEVFFLLEATAP
ncbi:MAG: SAM-dependent methyltransferase [Phycisphaerae bacterium]